MVLQLTSCRPSVRATEAHETDPAHRGIRHTVGPFAILMWNKTSGWRKEAPGGQGWNSTASYTDSFMKWVGFCQEHSSLRT